MLYPLILNNFQPAFLTSTLPYKIYFQLSDLQDINEVKHIQIRIAYQMNNITIGNTQKFPDGIIYKTFNKEFENGLYYTIIEASDLIQSWQDNIYYKVQLRFGSDMLWNHGSSFTDFASWQANSIQNNLFSEWSTVMTLKSISEPQISIKNSESIVKNINPIFYGSFSSNSEPADLYKFQLYNVENNLIQDSGWLQHNQNLDNNSNNTGDSFQFNILLEDKTTYKVKYNVQTKNYYLAESDYYIFQTAFYNEDRIENISLEVIGNDEEGSADCKIKISNFQLADKGTYFISRLDETSNYSTIQDIFEFILNDESEKFFQDRTLEYGLGYKYILSKYDETSGQRNLCNYEDKIIKTYFDSIFLVADDQQIKLNYNASVNSYKKTTLASKQDTIGGKYPIFQRNGFTYYTELTLTALITAHSDQEYNLIDFFDTNLTKENLLIEKQYRQKVETFLMNDSLKLFRSPTEGNIIIYLMNVSFSPQTQLNRFLYNVSCSLYEAADCTYDNILNYQIQKKEKT